MLVLSEGVFPVGLLAEDEANKDVSILKGKVTAVEECKVPVEGSQENFFCVTVDTPYGPIDIAHTADLGHPEQVIKSYHYWKRSGFHGTMVQEKGCMNPKNLAESVGWMCISHRSASRN